MAVWSMLDATLQVSNTLTFHPLLSTNTYWANYKREALSTGTPITTRAAQAASTVSTCHLALPHRSSFRPYVPPSLPCKVVLQWQERML